jgi:CXXX repeat modification system protein
MTERRRVGKVTESERDEIRRLVERANGLRELGMILDDGDPLHDRLIADSQRTANAKQSWWATMSRRYGWESVEGARWNVDFATREVWLENAGETSSSRG